MTIEAVNNIPAEQSVIGSLKDRVLTAVKRASDATGVDFSYLMAKAERESSLDPAAKAKSSSATGLFQFIDQTWLKMVKTHGDKYGLDGMADKIKINADGSACVSDKSSKKAILELRKDPEICSLMAAELAKENQCVLKSKVGGKIGGAELYMAHFLGPNSAAKLLQAMKKDPAVCAADIVPDAAESNRNVFFDKAGNARSVKEVYNQITRSMGKTTYTAPVTSTAPLEFNIELNVTRAPPKSVAIEAPVTFSAYDNSASLRTAFMSAPDTAIDMQEFAAQCTDGNNTLFATMLLAQTDWAAGLSADIRDKS